MLWQPDSLARSVSDTMVEESAVSSTETESMEVESFEEKSRKKSKDKESKKSKVGKDSKKRSDENTKQNEMMNEQKKFIAEQIEMIAELRENLIQRAHRPIAAASASGTAGAGVAPPAEAGAAPTLPVGGQTFFVNVTDDKAVESSKSDALKNMYDELDISDPGVEDDSLKGRVVDILEIFTQRINGATISTVSQKAHVKIPTNEAKLEKLSALHEELHKGRLI